MARIPGTNISAPVLPWDDADIYPTHHAKYGKGGFRSVATLDERDSITDMRKENGMFVYVIENETLYVYKIVDDIGSWIEWSGGSSGSTYQEYNFPSSSTVWNIPHNLGLYPSVITVDSSREEIFGKVEYTDSNNIKITFSEAVSGKAFINY